MDNGFCTLPNFGKKEQFLLKKNQKKENVSMETNLWRSWFGVLLRPKSFLSKLLLLIARSQFVHPKLRIRLQKIRGVKFIDPTTVFIGADVYFDAIKPENVTIGKNVFLTEGVKILCHFYDTHDVPHRMKEGKVVIEDNVFLGFNVIIAAPVRIGKNAVVGANSVVTKDIESNAIAGGLPAKIIGYRSEKVEASSGKPEDPR